MYKLGYICFVMKYLALIDLLFLLRLGQCQCLATTSSAPENIAIFSKKNGITIQFSPLDPIQSKIKVEHSKGNIDFTTSIKTFVMLTFFPLGFPEKTLPGLLSFCIWCWIQDLSVQM